ncbi:MAG: enoyl-CoA hydratase/isomerase family protein [Acidimicrobiaceae bacterium]|nr:enoyl-CoA hydratase/isomerase family protein [Acidimicrobiaceae bacterium]
MDRGLYPTPPYARVKEAAVMHDTVLAIEQRGAVLHLQLNRPEKRNALSAELRGRLLDAFEDAASDESVSAILLSGAGDHFCAGFDLSELAAAEDPAALFADAGRYHQVIHESPTPIVAAVRGSAVAGGFDLALMADLRVAATDAVFGQPQVRHGIPASYDLVVDAVGDPLARDICLTGRLVLAQEAVAARLVHRLTGPETLMDVSWALADEVASNAGAATTKAQILIRQPDRFKD